MDLKEAKRLIAYARRKGIQRLKWGDLDISFHEGLVLPFLRELPAASVVAPADKQTKPAPEPLPTLDDINKFIYENTDEAH